MAGKGLEVEQITGKEVNVQSLYRNYIGTELSLTLCEQIETYQYRSRTIDAKQTNDPLVYYRRVGTDIRGGKPTVAITGMMSIWTTS